MITTMPLPTRSVQKYGWVPDLPDMHDAVLGLDAVTSPMPDKVDLATSEHMPPIYSQLSLGACTAHGIKRVVDFDNHLQVGAFYNPSRLFIYYFERYIEGTIDQDSGAQIRDGIKVVNKIGNVPESDWPYDVSTFATPPADIQALVKKADADRTVKYARVPQTQAHIQRVLAGNPAYNGGLGKPIVFGFTVYESFESDEVATTGIMPMPVHGEQVVGGHCVAGVGYEVIDNALYLKCANSWDTTWGADGYFYMPMRYVLTPALASDLWVVYTTDYELAA